MVIDKHSNSHPNNIRTDTGGTMRRNRHHLRKICGPPPTAALVLDDFLDDSTPLASDEPAVAPKKRTRSGQSILTD